MAKIKALTGWEILNAKGKPTVQAELTTDTGLVAIASTPSGSSTGQYEAHELYDGGSRFGGFGARQAARNISTEIADRLRGMDVTDQEAIDRAMIELDGTPNKARLGGNAIMAVSAAAAKAGAVASGLPVYRHICRGAEGFHVPHVVSTVISGGAFSPSGLEFEDYLLLLDGFGAFSDEVEAICAMRSVLGRLCRERFGVVEEDNGALAPPLRTTREAFELMLRAAREAGCESMVHLGLDVAALGFFNAARGTYFLGERELEREALADYYRELCRDYPLIYIEDPFEENDYEGFAALTRSLPGVQIAGDDIFATNRERLGRGIELGAGNMLLMKLNQVGTVTETLETAALARAAGFGITASLRSGETTDDFQADVAVAAFARQMKLGSPVRGERNAKYNRLLRIAGELE